MASAGNRFVRPAFLPGSRVLLAQLAGTGPSVVAIRIGDSSFTDLVPGGQHPHYVEGGALVYGISEGSIFVVPFDAAALRVTGPAEPLTDQVVSLGGVISRFAVARTGTLAYLAGLGVGGRDLILTDRGGVAQVVPIGQRLYRFPRFSPDGRVLAFGVETRGPIGGDIWRYPVAGGAPLRLTADTLGGQPEWDPDGTSLVYARRPSAGARIELYRVSADGSDAPRPLLARSTNIYESRITPDRRTIVFREDAGPTDRNIFMAPLDSPTAVRPVAATSFDEKGLTLSPDGKWIAYVSNETGSDQVYIRKLQEVSSRWPVTQGGGTEPRWIRTGELFYRKGDSVMVTRVELGAEPRISAPRLLFTGNYVSTGYEPVWDVSADGQRFAFVRATAAADAPMGLLLNWADHWRARRR